jgi:hypothetical protein
VEDYGVIYLGSAIFKIARLLFIAMFSVHLFACIFFRVKVATAFATEDVVEFYTSKNVEEDVSKQFSAMRSSPIAPENQNFNDLCCCRPWQINMYVPIGRFSFFVCATLRFLRLQLVCFYYVLTTFTTVGYGEIKF